jgi:phosphate acetyltransferase
MKPLERILATAKQAPKRIVLPEGEDPRIVEAAIRASHEGVAEITLVGNRGIIEQALADAGASQLDLRIEDPVSSALASRLANAYFELRKTKGVDEASAVEALRSPLVFAAMMVREGEAPSAALSPPLPIPCGRPCRRSARRRASGWCRASS